MRPALLNLITIPVSHFCEKARWALDRLGLPYSEERHLQIFHYLRVIPTAGVISVPVLETESVLLRDSTDILQWIDRQLPEERRLYPTGPKGQEALTIEEELDATLGVVARRLAYQWLLPDRGLIERYMGAGAPAWQVRAGMAMFPLAAGYLRARLGVRQARHAEDVRATDRIFQDVSARLEDGRRFLLGGVFTAADLTFAALSAVILMPEEYGITMPRLEELPGEMRAHVERWRATPAGALALRLYREERRAPHAHLAAARAR